MPVKPLRRLNVQAGQSLFARLSAGVLHYAWSPSDVDAIERDHPRLIVERDGNILTAFRTEASSLAYSFHNESAFVDHFPEMFEELLPRLRRELHADTVRFRLDYAPSKPVVEPVLRRLSFSPTKPWLGFTLRREDARRPSPVKGVTFRDGGIADIDEMISLDRECFPDTSAPASVLRAAITTGGDRLLFAETKAGTAGVAMYSLDGDAGYLSTLAVREAYRGRGIGAALTLRVAKTLFAEKAASLALKTDADNAPAIRLYRGLGFAQDTAGRDYERPADPRVVAAMQQAGEGTFIRFGGWR